MQCKLEGAGLVWTRASFDCKTAQVNNLIKLTVEVFTKVKGSGI